MARILCIETSTKVCSVGISIDGEITQLEEDLSNRYSHAENVNVFVQKVLGKMRFSEIDAVAVSQGPGSYTGLRIGVSTAKGICLGQNIPLLAINPLEAMATGVSADENTLKIPMIDARRMEVFCSAYNSKGEQVIETQAEIITDTSFQNIEDFSKVLFFGDGAEKCRETLLPPRFQFIDRYASAKGMAGLSEKKFSNKDFESLAYFEPFYLKDFVAGKPKKGLP